MNTESSNHHNQLEGFFDYTNHLQSLWTQFIDTSLTETQRVMQASVEFNQTALLTQKNFTEALEYSVDFFQRSILFWDVIRQRGNQYLKHLNEGQPPVLIFAYKIIIDGRILARPVNYALIEIIPPANLQIDKTKRPYVIVDPRAGHGAGISGFKDESQVGIALRAQHPVYVVIFYPQPEPHQTLADVTMAHEQFLNEVTRRHPDAPKPCIIGNCQGGWAVSTLVAAHPDTAGVIVINGAPLAYWGGEKGKNPMRYIGGILGGSWIVQFAGDLGNGQFDGANLVMNFENANPHANFWKKYLRLFTHIDTEEKRFLNFERWWGGYSLLNANEMRSIVNNLFIGNKLIHKKIPIGTSGNNLDLRNIRVPVIIFCSKGDEITPPQQALNWIADLYDSTLELKLEGQVIVYLIHESIGHLGIFVSSEVAKKEHSEIIDLLNYIELLAPGLYELKLRKSENNSHYLAYIEERSIEDIREHTPHESEVFNMVRMTSEYNVMSYDFFISPLIRAFSNEYTADMVRAAHPLRQNQYWLSDINPLLFSLKDIASWIKNNRISVDDSNPFLIQQTYFTNLVSALLKSFVAHRDGIVECIFYSVYEYLKFLAPFDPHRDMIVHAVVEDDNEKMIQYLIAHVSDGGMPEAIIRIIFLLIKSQGFIIALNYPGLLKTLQQHESLRHLESSDLKQLVHNQVIMIEHDPELALTTLPHLIKNKKECRELLNFIEKIIQSLKISPSEKYHAKFKQIKNLLQEKFKAVQSINRVRASARKILDND